MSGKKGGGGGGGVGNGFKPMGLSDEVFKGIVRMGFRNPTPVQRKALPIVLTGVDTCVMARTGSGKTCAFLIPLLEKLLSIPRPINGSYCRGLVLSPTRELSLQTLRVLQKLSHFTDIKAIGIHGGEGMEHQFDMLASKPDVIVATPGRLAHHVTEIPDFSLKNCGITILDEADRLIEMGFAAQIRQITRTLPDQSQKVLLSATMPKMLIEFTKNGFLSDPHVVRLDSEAAVSKELRIAFITCRSMDKDAALLHIVDHIERDQEKNESTRTGLTLIFCATRHHVEFVTALLIANGQQATLVYGTLDQEARKSNLAAFRAGRKPILVVTDVAARGIDVPLIDHVIHYQFPPNAKLFVHRSGRAARAGRIGFCWGIVEPDELPYMVDLHLFLGRRLSAVKDDETYTLNEMTPEMVNFGSVPESVLVEEVENVRRIMDAELTGSGEAESMRNISRVCINAMKQYRRTRPEASKEGVRRAKALLEGERLETGERVNSGGIPPHPLLRGDVLAKYELANKNGKIGSVNNLQQLKERENFLRAVANFRPKETVFEAFATGGGKDAGVLSQVDKGRTTAASKKFDAGFALSAMKNMRRQMKLARNKGSALVVAGSDNALEMNGDLNQDAVDKKEQVDNDETTSSNKAIKSEPPKPSIPTKARLSKAERKRIKKTSSTVGGDEQAQSKERTTKAKKEVQTSFRDAAFFISNDITTDAEEAHRLRQVEVAMQPSASQSSKGSMGAALRMEEAMLDIVGDENEELVQKQRMMRWDKSKRKYVETTVGFELNGDSKSKKLRLESGQLVKKDKMKLGEVYEKWQKKTNRSVGRSGVFDDPVGDEAGTGAGPTADMRSHKGRKNSNGKNNGGTIKGGNDKGKGSNNKNNKGNDVKRRGADDIKKERDRKSNMKLKNMKKSDRRRLESSSGSSAPGKGGGGGGGKRKKPK